MSLTDMVLMPGKDYQNLCDTIRGVNPEIDYPITSDMVSPLVEDLANIDWLFSNDGGKTRNFYHNDKVISVNPYALAYACGPKTIVFPNAKSIDLMAFFCNPLVEKVYFKSLESMIYNAFCYASSLKFAHLGMLSRIPRTVFEGSSLETLVLAKSDSVVSLESLTAFQNTPFVKSSGAFEHPLPIELIEDIQKNNINYVYVNDFYGRDVWQNWDKNAMSIVEDDTSTTGKVLKIVAKNSASPYRYAITTGKGYLYLHNNGVLGKIPYSELKANEGKGYCLYKCSDIVVPTDGIGSYFWMFEWYLKHTFMGNKLNKLAGKTVDMYIYMKIDGGVDNPNTVTWYFDRFFVVEKPDDPTAVITPKIYVPKALIEEYKTATNWSALYSYGNCEFVALEGSEYE